MSASLVDLSGLLLSPASWQHALSGLQQPDCSATHVRLTHNQGHHVVGLLSALAANSSSCVINLDIQDLDRDGAHALKDFLVIHQRIIFLTLQHVREAAVQPLSEALALNSSIQSLSLTGLGDEALVVVATGLAKRPFSSSCLVQLQLQRGRLGTAAATALATAAAAPGTSLEVLHIKESGIKDDALAALLAPASLHGFMHLKELDLAGNHIQAQGGQLLGQVLPLSPSLRCLSLAHNKLGDSGISGLAQGLARAQALLHLSVSNCLMGPDGAAALASGLHGCAVLAELDASHNQQLGFAGFAVLMTALTSGACRCSKLQLDNCGIRGASAAQQLPQVAAPLRMLSLAENSLGDKGLAFLVPALSGTNTLEHLDLRNDSITDEGVEQLLMLLQTQAQLHTLVLDNNRLHNPGALRLMEAVGHHPRIRIVKAEGNRLTDPTIRSRLLQLGRSLVDPQPAGNLGSRNPGLSTGSAATRPIQNCVAASSNSCASSHSSVDPRVLMDFSGNSCCTLESMSGPSAAGRGRFSSSGGSSISMDCCVSPAQVGSCSQPNKHVAPTEPGSSSMSNPKCKRLRFKPLTPEQQRLFDDF